MSNPFESLIPDPSAPPPAFHWATVDTATPLSVVLDNDYEPLDGSPSKLVAVADGDRVFLVVTDGRAVILGKAV